MIIAFKSAKDTRDEYVVCPHSPLTVAELRDRMLQRAKVAEGSYAYRLVVDLHAALFVQSLELKGDYNVYFAGEYESFREYLRRRARFPSSVVARLAEVVDESSGVYHFRPWYDFLDDTYGLEFLTSLVENQPAGNTP